MSPTAVTCAECGVESQIRRPSRKGRLLWECVCGARNVDGEGLGHAAVDADDGLNFTAVPEVAEDVTLVVDGDGGEGSSEEG